MRDYWLPLLLFAGTLIVAAALLLLVVLMPYLIEYAPMFTLFAEETTVRRTSVVASFGLIVTAFVFFRPRASFLTRKPSPVKPPGDTMAGA